LTNFTSIWLFIIYVNKWPTKQVIIIRVYIKINNLTVFAVLSTSSTSQYEGSKSQSYVSSSICSFLIVFRLSVLYTYDNIVIIVRINDDTIAQCKVPFIFGNNPLTHLTTFDSKTKLSISPTPTFSSFNFFIT